jgi:hypothetical protein
LRDGLLQKLAEQPVKKFPLWRLGFISHFPKILITLPVRSSEKFNEIQSTMLYVSLESILVPVRAIPWCRPRILPDDPPFTRKKDNLSFFVRNMNLFSASVVFSVNR